MVKSIVLNGTEGLNALLRRLPKEAGKELRAAAQEMVQPIANQARANAHTPQERKVAATITALKRNTPTVRMGGKRIIKGRSRRPNPERQRIGELAGGAEWGGRRSPTTMQFLSPTSTGYLLYPAGQRYKDQLLDEYLDALSDAVIRSAR